LRISMRLFLCALYSKPQEDRCLIIIDTEGMAIGPIYWQTRTARSRRHIRYPQVSSGAMFKPSIVGGYRANRVSAATQDAARSPNHVLRMSLSKAPTPGEYCRPLTVTILTSRQNSGPTTGNATTPGCFLLRPWPASSRRAHSNK
jgi:hypothetical protein